MNSFYFLARVRFFPKRPFDNWSVQLSFKCQNIVGSFWKSRLNFFLGGIKLD